MSRILILDSGINVNDKRYKYIKGKNFLDKGNEGDILDKNGHGTYCMSVIQKYYPNAQIVVSKILDDKARTSSKILIEALEDALNQNINIINLSAATLDEHYKKDLQLICKKLYHRGIIVVSSVANRKEISYPASLEYTIGVNGVYMNESINYWFNKSKTVQCVADLTPITVKDIDDTYIMFGGNSKATAVITSIIAKFIDEEKEYEVENIIDYMQQNAVNNIWDYNDIERGRDSITEYSYNYKHLFTEEELQKIVNLFSRVFKFKEVNEEWIYNNKLFYYLKPKDYYVLMEQLGAEYDMYIDYENLKFDTFYSVFTLAKYILKR